MFIRLRCESFYSRFFRNLFIAYERIIKRDHIIAPMINVNKFLSFETIVTANKREIIKILVEFLLNFDDKNYIDQSRSHNGFKGANEEILTSSRSK